MNDIIFLNGEYVERNSAKISIDDRGFHFGDGLYDVVLIYNEKIIDFDAHFRRMKRTSDKILMNLDYSKRKILQASEKLINLNQVKEGRLIIVVSRGNCDRWLNDINSLKQNFLIYVQSHDCKVGKNELKSIKLKSYLDIRWKWRDIKITSLLPSVVLREEANREGFDDILYISEDGFVSETSRANIFMVKDEWIYTHPANHQILPGITRNKIIELIKNNHRNINLMEREFSIEDMKNCDEVFVTSSTARIANVSLIDNFTPKNAKNPQITKEILKIYDDFVING